MASQVAKQVFASEVAAAEYAAATADRCCNLFMQSLGREEWLRDCAEADKRQAEEALVHERAARLVMEKLFAKEAAWPLLPTPLLLRHAGGLLRHAGAGVGVGEAVASSTHSHKCNPSLRPQRHRQRHPRRRRHRTSSLLC